MEIYKSFFLKIFENNQSFSIITLLDIRLLSSGKKVEKLLKQLNGWIEC